MTTKDPCLALLVCDIPIPAVVKDHGEYPMIFERFLRASLPDEFSAFTLDSYDIRYAMEYPKEDVLDTYDGIIISGSAASAYEDFEWIKRLVSWVATLATQRPLVKIIGICFGHQIVARALGGKCVSNSGKWEVAITEVALTDLGQRIFGAQSLARSAFPRICILDDNIQQMHRDHVPVTPPSFHLLGSTTITKNQGMVLFSDPGAPLPTLDAPIPQIHVLTLQGHPEFTAEIVKEVVKARSESGAMDRETAENAWPRADWHNDGVSLIGKAIWRVLLSAPEIG
ncbi:class I glutamine amidotransferase-like protein [Lactarius sanguifluus]|nr:class I glutamine amidotransferase-like protein [Lactarius sanguifluus]